MPKGFAHLIFSFAGFTRALCHELGPRSIRVNALLPGWVASPMWDRESFLLLSPRPPLPPSLLSL